MNNLTFTINIASFNTAINSLKDNSHISLDYIRSGIRNKSISTTSAVYLLNEACQGNAASQAHYLLGLLYLDGSSEVQKDTKKAIDHLKASQSADADYILGALFFKGLFGIEENKEEGMRFLISASEKGNPNASCWAGLHYWQGKDLNPMNSEKARHLLNANSLEQTSLKFCPQACSILADYAIEYHPHIAKKWIEESSQNSQVSLYRRFGEKQWSSGLGYGRTDAIIAWKRIAKLIPQNAPLAHEDKETLCLLGRSLYHIEEFPERYGIDYLKELQADGEYKADNPFEGHKITAVAHWRRAAEADHPMSQYYLGLAYCSGKGVQKNVAMGKEWLQKAAKSQFLPAQAMLNHLDGKQTLTLNNAVQDPHNLSPKEEQDCVYAQKNFLDKAWIWIKKHWDIILISTISAVAIGALIAGLVALTLFFPHVMIPIWIVAGGIGGVLVLLGAGFAAGGH